MTNVKGSDNTDGCFRTRLSRARASGDFHAYQIPTGKFRKILLKQLYLIVLLSWRGPLSSPSHKDKDKIQTGGYPFHDDLRASMGNKAGSSCFTPAAFNAYKGMNLKLNKDGTIERTAYATGSGATTIGLNPRTMKHLLMTPNDHRVMKTILKIATAFNPEWGKRIEKHPPNHCSLKGYWPYWNEDGDLVFKNCGFHADTTWTKRNVPMRNNSQVPNTLVFLLTFGADKDLWFRKHKTKSDFKEGSLLRFIQRHGSLTVIDTRDEKWDEEGYQWRHGSTMRGDGITWTYVIRTVCVSAVVNDDGTLADPVVTDDKEKKFDDAKDLFETDYYKQQREILDEGMDRMFKQYRPK